MIAVRLESESPKEELVFGRDQIRKLPLSRIEALAEAALSFSTVTDLNRWLERA